jgi:hypothetical protein
MVGEGRTSGAVPVAGTGRAGDNVIFIVEGGVTSTG